MKITLEIEVERRNFEEFRPVIGTGFTRTDGVRANNVHLTGSTVVQMMGGTQYVFTLSELVRAATAFENSIEITI